MSLLSSCCCRYSIRQGSFASGVYTLVYFILFALLTGNYSYHEIVERYLRPPGHSEEEVNLTSFRKSGNELLLEPVGNSSALNFSFFNGTLDYEDVPQPSDMVLILVDFFCEVSGIFASIFLIRGLQVDRIRYLIPWLVIVPLHTTIDTFTVINIIIMWISQSSSNNNEQANYGGFVTGVTVLLDFILNFINVYVFLCVFSQYQEYKAGRGTAAYEGLSWQGPSSVVRYDVGRESVTGAVNGNKRSCFSEAEKSDIWCEDLVLDKLDGHSVALDNWGRKKRGGSSRKTSNTTTVRFDCDEAEAGAEDPLTKPFVRFN